MHCSLHKCQPYAIANFMGSPGADFEQSDTLPCANCAKTKVNQYEDSLWSTGHPY